MHTYRWGEQAMICTTSDLTNVNAHTHINTCMHTYIHKFRWGEQVMMCTTSNLTNLNAHTYIETYMQTYIHIGGAEQAMMSTTSNLSVAVRYSLSADSLLFKIKVKSWTDHGAGA
jgi:hypothetical protein